MKFKPLDKTTPINQIPFDGFGDNGGTKYWLVVHALREQQLDISRTLVMSEEDEFIGFFNTKLGTCENNNKDVFLLTKLAMLKKFQEQKGYDKKMLLKCIQQAQEIFEIIPFNGILCGSRTSYLNFYIQFGFIHVFKNEVLLKPDQFESAIQKISQD